MRLSMLSEAMTTSCLAIQPMGLGQKKKKKKKEPVNEHMGIDDREQLDKPHDRVWQFMKKPKVKKQWYHGEPTSQPHSGLVAGWEGQGY